MHHHYRTQGVCSRYIDFDLQDGRITNLQFFGGCDGNLRAISKLLDGMPADQVIGTLAGNTCNGRPTSCADQLTRALADALEHEGAAPAAPATAAEA